MVELLRRLFGRGRDTQELADRLTEMERKLSLLEADYEARKQTKMNLSHN